MDSWMIGLIGKAVHASRDLFIIPFIEQSINPLSSVRALTFARAVAQGGFASYVYTVCENYDDVTIAA